MVWKRSKDSADVVHHLQVVVDRGCTFEQAQEHMALAKVDIGSRRLFKPGQFCGFYKNRNPFAGDYHVCLIIEKPHMFLNSLPCHVTIYRSGTGRHELSRQYCERYDPVSDTEAEKMWQRQYANEAHTRDFTHDLLVGSALSVWGTVQSQLLRHKRPMRIARVALDRQSGDCQSVGSSSSSSTAVQVQGAAADKEVVVGIYLKKMHVAGVLRALQDRQAKAQKEAEQKELKVQQSPNKEEKKADFGNPAVKRQKVD